MKSFSQNFSILPFFPKEGNGVNRSFSRLFFFFFSWPSVCREYNMEQSNCWQPWNLQFSNFAVRKSSSLNSASSQRNYRLPVQREAQLSLLIEAAITSIREKEKILPSARFHCRNFYCCSIHDPQKYFYAYLKVKWFIRSPPKLLDREANVE